LTYCQFGDLYDFVDLIAHDTKTKLNVIIFASNHIKMIVFLN